MFDRVLRLLAALSFAFIFFYLGATMAWLGTPPFEPWIRESLVGLDALVRNLKTAQDPDQHSMWLRVPDGADPAVGVVRHNSEKAHQGLVLITAGESAYIIDRDGAVLHSWSVPYAELSGGEPKESIPDAERRLNWPRGIVLPDGDFIGMVSAQGHTPFGLGMFRLDRDSNIKWVHLGSLHHDFDVAPDGRIFALDQEIKIQAPKEFPELLGPIFDEGVIILSPEGEPIKRISLLEAFARSDYASIVEEHARINHDTWGDYLHSNNLDIADSETAEVFDFVEVGDILLSLREIDTIAVLNPESEVITWAARGSWHRQHDPDFLPNGNIMLFDNKGDWRRGARSRVIEYDPKTEAIVWQYPEDPESDFYSDVRAEQAVLPNGNVLANEFGRFNLLEITRDGEIVWAFRCPFRRDGNDDELCITTASRPYEREDLPFLVAP